MMCEGKHPTAQKQTPSSLARGLLAPTPLSELGWGFSSHTEGSVLQVHNRDQFSLFFVLSKMFVAEEVASEATYRS